MIFRHLARWMDRETPAATFTRQALPILWDFCEMQLPWMDASWSITQPRSVQMGSRFCELWQYPIGEPGQVQQAECHRPPIARPMLPTSGLPTRLTTTQYRMRTFPTSSSFGSNVRCPDHPLLLDPFDSNNPLSPKTFSKRYRTRPRFCNGRPKNRQWFEETMASRLR